MSISINHVMEASMRIIVRSLLWMTNRFHNSLSFTTGNQAPSSLPRGIVGNFLGLSNHTMDKVQNDVE